MKLLISSVTVIILGLSLSGCGGDKKAESADISTTPESSGTEYYVSKDPEQCKVVRFYCKEGLEPFFNEKGCGCK